MLSWLNPFTALALAISALTKEIRAMAQDLVAAVDRLTSVVTDLESKLAAEVAALAAAVAASGTTDPDIAASVERLNAISDNLTADAATLVQPAPSA